jgi:glyoxylase-like metal-dependent hydrolase (beta-lactamase superfamily II)
MVDGQMRQDGGALYGMVPKVLWSKLMKPDRRNRVTLNLNCFLIQSGGRNILVDTGVGTKHSRRRQQLFAMRGGRLVNELAAAGLTPADIHIVVLTHLHFDHSGGATRFVNDEPVPTFPNARCIVQRADWHEVTHLNDFTRGNYLVEDYLALEKHGALELVEGDVEIAPGVWVRHTGGHTAGHQAVYIESRGEKALCLADVLPTQHHLRHVYITSWDVEPVVTVAQKVRYVEQAAKGGWLLLFNHGVECQAGYVVEENGRLRIRPYKKEVDSPHN